MDLKITSTPRATHLWAPSVQQASELRRELTEYGFLVRDADPWELDEAGLIPDGQQDEFDPTRIFDVAIGADANATLQALVDSGHRRSRIWTSAAPSWSTQSTTLNRRGIPGGERPRRPALRWCSSSCPWMTRSSIVVDSKGEAGT